MPPKYYFLHQLFNEYFVAMFLLLLVAHFLLVFSLIIFVHKLGIFFQALQSSILLSAQHRHMLKIIPIIWMTATPAATAKRYIAFSSPKAINLSAQPCKKISIQYLSSGPIFEGLLPEYCDAMSPYFFFRVRIMKCRVRIVIVSVVIGSFWSIITNTITTTTILTQC